MSEGCRNVVSLILVSYEVGVAFNFVVSISLLCMCIFSADRKELFPCFREQCLAKYAVFL